MPGAVSKEQQLPTLDVQQPDRLAVTQLPVRKEAPASVEALGPRILRMHRKPNILRVRSGLADVRNEEFHGRRPKSLPLPRSINGKVQQFCVRPRVRKCNDSNH